MKSTPPEEAAHGFYTRRSSTGKRVEVAAVGEHNSPPTPGPRDQFQVHQLTGDIGQDNTLPSPMRDYPQLDDDSHIKEEPSKLPSLVRDCPRPDDDSHAKEEPSRKTPVSTYP